MKTKKLGIAAVFILLALAGCKDKIKIPIEELTKDGYFTLRESNEKGRYGPVVILPERHNSRLIQAEFGWALNILLESCGMNTIALEGMFEGETMITEKKEYASEIEKYEVLLAVLEKGDIKAPEFMYFAKDSFVFGIENEAEYNVDFSGDANMALFRSLIISIIVDQGADIVESVESYLEAEELDFDGLFALNPWTLETYNIINESRSLTETNTRINELEEKTKFLFNAQIRDGFSQFKKYNETTLKRSFTMAGNVYDRLRKNNEPLAMIIGAAHTEDVIGFFDKNKVKYYVLEPSGLNAESIWSDFTTKQYERKNKGMSVYNEEIGGFFDETHNSRPTHAKYWVKQQFNFIALIRRFANAFASSPPPHDNFPPNILINGDLRIVQVFSDISTTSDIKFLMINSKGEDLYVRLVENNMGGNYEFVNLEKSFQDMIRRLSEIDEQNLSYEQKISAYGGVIEAIYCLEFMAYVSVVKEPLFSIPREELW